jgi:hypothetical protein
MKRSSSIDEKKKNIRRHLNERKCMGRFRRWKNAEGIATYI